MEMLAKDDADSKGLGLVGTMSDEMLTEALFWRLVCNLRLSPKEIEAVKNYSRGKSTLINLGKTRLRARTAAIVALGKFF